MRLPAMTCSFRLAVLLVTLWLTASLLGPSSAVAQGLPDSSAHPGPVLPDPSFDAVDDADDTTPEAALEDLSDLADRPLDVNRASAAELSRIPSLTVVAARRIVAYRRAEGRFAAVDDLRTVPGLSADAVRHARPYLTVRGDAAAGWADVVRDLDVDWMQHVSRRLDLGRGYDVDSSGTSRYAGSAARHTTRLRVGYQRRGLVALTLDKDPGEAFAWTPPSQTYGFDHVSGTASVADVGPLERIVVGDFHASFGQGLVLWDGAGFGKGRNPVAPVVRDGRGLSPSASAEENRFFRGAGVTVQVAGTDVTAFASRRRLDATLQERDERDAPRLPGISTLTTSGLHRTETERQRKDAVRAETVGAALEHRWERAHVGVAGVHNRFDHPLTPGGDAYAQFDVRGRTASMASVYGSLSRGSVLGVGEVAWDADGTPAGSGGVVFDDGRRAEVVVAARVYPRDFTTLYGSGFGERRATQNETGVYLGTRLQVAPRWTVSGYVDQYRFPWLRYTVPRPTRGADVRLVVAHEPRTYLSHYVQLRSETRGSGTDVLDASGRAVGGIAEETRQSLRWHVAYVFSDALTLRTRIEAVRAHVRTNDGSPDGTSSRGVLLYQDVRWQARPSLQVDARLAHFQTDDFDARVYAYEYDVLYSFSVPALHGTGRRAYLLLRYAPARTVTLEAKYGVTTWPRRQSVGSGLDVVDGNRLRTVRLQLRLSL